MSGFVNKDAIRTWYGSIVEDVDYLLEQFLSLIVAIVVFDDPGILQYHQKSGPQATTNTGLDPGTVKIESGSLKGL